MKTIVISFIAVMALWVMTACVNDPDPSERTLSPGDKCPAFFVVMNDGSVFDSTLPDDKLTVILFFNTDCPDCRRELPLVQSLYEQSSDSVRFVCISREEDAERVSHYWAENNLTLPYSAQTDRYVYSLFADSGIPRTYIVNKEGYITSTRLSNLQSITP
ncbi:MAG: TlpA family protein disulfide reductase [Lachnospiraceae bacterium]|nr:TlpA family protein disulfide reductase [Prevotella sp.]MCM1075695.1 TlpA family protein disulfide reductase [Ruminococcus sp.]MCM1222637.1 TlpA family protein disulfide reductase [Lachnospiraceae bacterium]